MSTEPSTPVSTPAATPSTPAPTTPAAPTSAPASLIAPAAPAVDPAAAAPAAPAPVAEEWKEFVVDPAKTDAENAAAKADHDAKKPAAPAEAAPTQLTPADIQLPEGFEVDEPVMNEFLGIQNDPKLTPAERSQKLIDLQIKASKEGLEKATQAWETRMTDWQTEVRNDPTVGGAKFDQSVATANKVVQQLGSPELAQLCADTGIGNNVHFVKFLTAIAPKVLEAAPVNPGAPPASPQSQDARAQRMYPTMKK